MMRQKRLTLSILVIILFLSSAPVPILSQTSSIRAADTGWFVIPFPYDEHITQSILFDSSNGWAFNANSGQVYQLQDSLWEIVPTLKQYKYLELFGFSIDNIWFCCFDKKNYRYFLRHFNGQSWQNIYTPNADRVRGLEYLAPDNIWGVCAWGEIIHFDGQKWELVPCPVFTHLNCISMASDSCGWIGGEYRGKGLLLHWNGSKWTLSGNVVNYEIINILMVNSSIGWVFVNNDSIAIKLDKNSWHYVTFSSLVRDTVAAVWKNIINPIFIYQHKAAVHDKNLSNITLPNGTREALYSLPQNKHSKIYTFYADGSLKFIKSKPYQMTSNSAYKFSSSETGYQYEYGVAFGDFDSDGDDDIYVINAAEGNRLRLFGGNSRIKSAKPNLFVEAADRMNLLGIARTSDGNFVYDMGVTLADIDNDGDRDVYITSLYDNNMLYENINNINFREIAEQAGAAGSKTRSNVGICGDVDKNGDVDLFVTNEDTTNMLFLNNGSGRFREITSKAGLISKRSGKGATFGDIDLDGDLDLIVPYFSRRNRVYRNEGIKSGSGTPFFTDVTNQWLPLCTDSIAKSTSACLADFDNDGDLDLYITNLVTTNRLYQNDGTGFFSDFTEAAGVKDSSLSNSACFFDADNDGDLDLFVSNRGRNLFFTNSGNGAFSRGNKVMKLEPDVYSTGFACGDPDGDGDIDCYLANDDHSSIHYKNLVNNKNFLKIKLIGTVSNYDAIGAKVFLYEAGHLDDKNYLLGLREVNGGSGYGCMNSTTIHFGANYEKRYDLKIIFSGGIKVTKTNIQPGQILLIEEQAGWSKFISVNRRTILRKLKTPKNQLEFVKFLGLLTIFILTGLIVTKKQWVKISSIAYLFPMPVFIYLFFTYITSGNNFWLSHAFPVLAAILLFITTIVIFKRQAIHRLREHLAEELLLKCKAFDHGSWATSYLNRFQLFSTNVSPNLPIPEKAGKQLQETITGFYELVYSEIDNIHQLAVDAAIQINRAAELKRQLLYLSENLNKIKIALAMQQGLSSEIWQNVYRLTDQIKMNIREINFGAARLFSCNVLPVIQKYMATFEKGVNFPVELVNFDKADNEIMVCIRKAELTAIFDNLSQNALHAMAEQQNPQIKITFAKTDQIIAIEFADNGKGIHRKLWHTIFDRNFTTKPEGEGGFGLYYSRRTLEKYGGSIEVKKSSVKKGTTFLIKLRRI